MKLLACVKLLFFCLVISDVGAMNDPKNNGNDQVMYRYAEKNDLEGLLEIYEEMDDDDGAKLVILPKNHRCTDLEEAINARQLFVAHHEGGKLLAFLKLYTVSGKDLEKKRSIVGSLDDTKPPCSTKVFTFPNVQDALCKPLCELENPQPTSFSFPSNGWVYLYYGSSYTRRNFRGKGIISRLSEYAFEQVIKFEVIVGSVFEDGRRYISFCLLYGVVKENLKNVFIDKAFHKVLQEEYGRKNFTSESVVLAKRLHSIKMPAFKDDNGSLIQVPGSIDAFGCVVTYEIYKG